MPLHDFHCSKCDNQFESIVEWTAEEAPCPQCQAVAPLVWLNARQRHLKDPIVVFKLADGSYSFPGTSGARTPKGAERIEMRSMADYTRQMGRINRTLQADTERREERIQANREHMVNEWRREITQLIANTSDPLAKDIGREALRTYNTARRTSHPSYVTSEAMEYYSSNREADRRGRK